MKMTVRPATFHDVAALPAIERAAGQRFREIPALAWLADSPAISAERHLACIEQGMSWLALVGDKPVGFILAEIHPTSLFIVELSVHLDWQRKGVGRQLIACAVEQARKLGLTSLTLTTFRDVPWNAPFYTRLGFAMLDELTLPAGLAAKREQETRHGLPPESRCAMRLSL